MFYFDTFNGKKILKSTLLADVDCFFSTRDFVLTHSSREDLKADAIFNRNLLKENYSISDICTAVQIHSSNISLIEKNVFEYKDTDALVSNIPNTLLLMNFADCVPIILYSKTDNVGAIVHAGWRGTVSKIVEKTVAKIKTEFGVNPENITAIIGPAIGKCCFETDEDVFNQLILDKSLIELYDKKNDKYFIDLKLLNKYQLLNSGIINIDICDYCTCCMSDIFFSYRKEKGITARHSAILKIKGDRYVSN